MMIPVPEGMKRFYEYVEVHPVGIPDKEPTRFDIVYKKWIWHPIIGIYVETGDNLGYYLTGER